VSVRLLQRQLAPVQALQPGQYTTETASGRVAIRCHECGGVSELDEVHTVRGAGIVTPIWSCPFVCPAMVFLTLESWGEEVLR